MKLLFNRFLELKIAKKDLWDQLTDGISNRASCCSFVAFVFTSRQILRRDVIFKQWATGDQRKQSPFNFSREKFSFLFSLSLFLCRTNYSNGQSNRWCHVYDRWHFCRCSHYRGWFIQMGPAKSVHIQNREDFIKEGVKTSKNRSVEPESVQYDRLIIKEGRSVIEVLLYM